MIDLNKIKNVIRPIKFRLKNDFPYRKYFRKNKCIFIHIPKNAGTSILSSLSNGGKIYRDHATWKEYYRHNPYKFKDYYKFTFVRNPFDRLVSTYFYLLKGGNQNHDLYFKKYFAENEITFERFVMEYLDNYNIYENMMLAPQYIYVYDFKYNLKVNFVGKIENLQNDYIELSKKVKGLGELKKTNPSQRDEDYKKYYNNSELIDKVVELYKKDFEFFNYSKQL